MENKISRKEFIALYAKKMGMSRRKATELCVEMLDLLAQCIVDYDVVLLRGLGSFQKKTRAERRIGDLRTGGTKIIPAKKVVVFKLTENAGAAPVDDEDGDDEAED